MEQSFFSYWNSAALREIIDINLFIHDSLRKNADQDSAAPDSGSGFAINTLYDLERATVVLWLRFSVCKMAVMMNPVFYCQLLHYTYLQESCSLNLLMPWLLTSKRGIIILLLSTYFDYILFMFGRTWSAVGACPGMQTTHFSSLPAGTGLFDPWMSAVLSLVVWPLRESSSVSHWTDWLALKHEGSTHRLHCGR